MKLKYTLSISLFLIALMGAAQQRPFVSGLSQTSGTVGETIFISGSGFTATCQVKFGNGAAQVVNTSANQLEVIVPATATYGPVTVTDTGTRLSAVSSDYFSLSFGGQGFDVSQLDAQFQTSPQEQTYYDLCTCDFDGDGKTDVVVSNSETTNMAVFRNTGSLAAPAFAKTSLNLGSGFNSIFSVDCSDLNGDGKDDLVLTNNQGTDLAHVFVYRNTSTVGAISFSNELNFRLPNQSSGDTRNARKVKIVDIDGDGKKEVVVGSQSDNVLFVYLNQTTSSTISLVSTPVQVQVSSGSQIPTNTGSFDPGDFNNDGLLDIAVASHKTPNENIYLIQNTSTPGSIRFDEAVLIPSLDNRTEIISVDVDNDGLLDLVSSSDFNDRITLFKNDGNFSFSKVSDYPANGAWGLAVGDVDGDGFSDAIAASVVSGVHVAINNSGSGTIGFNNPVAIPTTDNNRNIKLADLNGDAKPDFAFTHNINTSEASDLSVILNRNCLEPVISPADLTFCLNNSFTIGATKTLGATYDWSITSLNGTVVENADEATFTITSGTSAAIEVTITSDDGGCIDVATETFSITGGAPPAAPTITPSTTDVVCGGDAFSLAGPAGQDNYFWTLPDGTTSQLSTLNITDANPSHAGTYELRVQVDPGCISLASTVTVSVDEPPAVSIVNSGANDFCETASVDLEVPSYPGFTYQWRRDGADVGTDLNTFTASESGDYTVGVISDASGCENESAAIALTAVPLPVSAFTSVDEICVGVPVDFYGDSDTTAGFTVEYSWDFGDGSDALNTSDTISHTFTTPGTYDVLFTTSYPTLGTCENTFEKTITVSAIPTIAIEATSLEKCPADSILLSLPGNVVSAVWTVNGVEISTTNTAYAVTATGEDEVTVSVEMVTDIGCTVTDDITISNFANSRIEVSSPDGTITNDTITLDTNLSTVTLEATNGSDYEWSPASILSTTTGPSVKVFPPTQRTTVTVTGTDAVNGCETTRNIVIITPGLIPRKSFSPNGDGLGFDCWEILNSDGLDGCTVYVMDQRGSYVFKGDSPFADNCVWNGNIDNGSSQAPEGIYYFVLKCDNSTFDTTGTILLGR